MLIDNSTEQLIQGVLRHGPDILEHCVSLDNLSQYSDRVLTEKLRYPIPPKAIDHTDWFIPKEYKNFDIKNWVLEQCLDVVSYQRAQEELGLFAKYQMIPMLRTMKYIVDTLRSNNVIWGVGRGSSVASYVLHIIGVHKINPIKYNIPIEEFFKEKQNG
jgi:DNA polymerase III alpha subunit